MEPLFPHWQIQQAVGTIGQQVDAAYWSHSSPLVLIGVLKGAFCFLADLARAIERPNVWVDFLEAGSYGNSQHSSGNVTITKDITGNVRALDVLLVEDIVDTGLTAFRLLEHLYTKQPHSVEVATLLDVPGNRKFPAKPKFVGFTLQPGDFVYGYGLDLRQDKRHLPDIYRVER